MEMSDTLLIAGISSIFAVALLFVGVFISGHRGSSVHEK